MKCLCCEADKDTRFGICFDCAEYESIIDNGFDMSEKQPCKFKELENYSMSMSKVKYILRSHVIQTNYAIMLKDEEISKLRERLYIKKDWQDFKDFLLFCAAFVALAWLMCRIYQ